MNLRKDRKGKTKVKVNGSLGEQGLRMHMGKKIWHHERGLMQLDMDMGHNNLIEVRALVSWSVRNKVRNTLGDIVCKIRVVGLRYTLHKRHRLLGM